MMIRRSSQFVIQAWWLWLLV